MYPTIESLNADLNQRFKRIQILVMDVDGVMTDGGLMLGDDGQEYKTFYSHDGLGMKILQATGIQLAIITARSSSLVLKRAQNTGIQHVYQGAEDKLVALHSLLNSTQIPPQHCAFMGDDVVDLPPMLHCGLAIAVPASSKLVLEKSHYITQHHGGRGAVREVCELIMQSQGTFEAQMQRYLRQAT